MPNSVIILKPVAGAPVDSTLLELTLRATDATPENIILYPRPSLAAAGLVVITLVAMGITDSWPTVNQVTGGIEWYQDGFKYTGAASAGSAVFPVAPDVKLGVIYGPSGTDYTGTYNPTASAIYPAVGDVDSGVPYGPSGSDYSGTLVQPAVADVRSGTTYGAGGTEFTGTLVAGGGGFTSALKYDIETGRLVKILTDKLAISR
jgi:hypothetical protein